MPANAAETDETPEIAVRICQDVLDELRFCGSWNRDQVACGLLIGHHVQTGEPDSSSHQVTVVGYYGGDYFHDLDAFMQSLLRSWKEDQKQIVEFFPPQHREKLEILGWYAAWPKEGAALGQQASLIQNSFFTKPYHIVLWLTTPPRTLTSHPAPVPPADSAGPMLQVATESTMRCLSYSAGQFIPHGYSLISFESQQTPLP